MTPIDAPDKETIEFCKAAIAESDKQLRNDTIERCFDIIATWANQEGIGLDQTARLSKMLESLKDKP